MSLINEIKQKGSGTPATEENIRHSENMIGITFPKILRDLYSEVANGGIGPGYQILGVKGGHLSEEGDTISDLYLALSDSDPHDPLWQWPVGVVPFCHWGDAIYSCFDASKNGNPVVWFDPNLREMGEPMQQQFAPHRESLESWFRGWLEGQDLWSEKKSAS